MMQMHATAETVIPAIFCYERKLIDHAPARFTLSAKLPPHLR